MLVLAVLAFSKYLGSKWFLQIYDDDVGSQSFPLANLIHLLIMSTSFGKKTVHFFCNIIRVTTQHTAFINHNNKLPINPTLLLTSLSLRLSFCKPWTEQIKIISQTNVWQLFSIILLLFLFTFPLSSCFRCHALFSIERVQFFNSSIVL